MNHHSNLLNLLKSMTNVIPLTDALFASSKVSGVSSINSVHGHFLLGCDNQWSPFQHSFYPFSSLSNTPLVPMSIGYSLRLHQ